MERPITTRHGKAPHPAGIAPPDAPRWTDGIDNPHLSPKLEPLDLTTEEVGALVAFMDALNGEGYMDTAPEAFPQ